MKLFEAHCMNTLVLLFLKVPALSLKNSSCSFSRKNYFILIGANSKKKKQHIGDNVGFHYQRKIILPKLYRNCPKRCQIFLKDNYGRIQMLVEISHLLTSDKM